MSKSKLFSNCSEETTVLGRKHPPIAKHIGAYKRDRRELRKP